MEIREKCEKNVTAFANKRYLKLLREQKARGESR
jgi:hypothetical protein